MGKYLLLLENMFRPSCDNRNEKNEASECIMISR